MTPHQPRDQQRAVRHRQALSRVTATVCIDLTKIDHHAQRTACFVNYLGGCEVVVRIGTLRIWDVHRDVFVLLADGVVCGAAVRVEGDPSVVGDWVREIRCHVGALEGERRLSAVKP